jgi:hypothetical protein
MLTARVRCCLMLLACVSATRRYADAPILTIIVSSVLKRVHAAPMRTFARALRVARLKTALLKQAVADVLS